MPYNRPLRELFPTFIDEAKAIDPYLAARKGVFSKPIMAGVGGLVRQAPMNLRLMKGLAAGQFFSCLGEFSQETDVPIHIFLSDGDTIAPIEVAKNGLDKLMPSRVTASTLDTPERHGVVYLERTLGLAISEAFKNHAL
jgi:hypothetical protein